MIRFAIKSALALTLVSLFLPSRGSDEESGASFDLLQNLSGLRAGVDDVLGICERTPDVCAAGSNLGAFAAEQIGTTLLSAFDAASVRGPASPEQADIADSPPPQTAPSWSDLDPVLLSQLYAALEDGGRIGADDISPQMVDAVREAARLARRNGTADEAAAARSIEAAFASDPSPDELAPDEVPMPGLPTQGPLPKPRPRL